MDKEKTTVTSIRLPLSLKKDLEELAHQDDRTLNNMMVIALRNYVRQNKKVKKE